MNRTLEPFGQFNVKASDGLKEKSVRFISALVKLSQHHTSELIASVFKKIYINLLTSI